MNDTMAMATLSNTVVQNALIELLIKKKLISDKDIRQAIGEADKKLNKHADAWMKRKKKDAKNEKPQPRPSYFG